MILRRLSAIARFIALWVALAVPLSLLAAAASGPGLAWVGAAAALLPLLILGCFATRIVVKALGGAQPAGAALRRTYLRALEENLQPDSTAPSLLCVTDPLPFLLAGRDWLGNGIVVASQGLIAALSEEELRACLAASARSAREPGLAVRTLAGALAVLGFRLAPKAWTRALFLGKPAGRLTPLGFLGFSAVASLSKACLGFGGAPGAFESGSPEAARKLGRSLSGSGLEFHPGLVRLYLIAPRPATQLLPL